MNGVIECNADAQPVGNRHPTLYCFQGFVDDILSPVAAGGTGISGLAKIGQGCQVNIMRPPDAALQHAPAPDGDIVSLGNVVHVFRLCVPAHAGAL